MQQILDTFGRVWLYDFEFHPDADLRPVPVCMVAFDMKSGQRLRLWRDQLDRCPFDTGRNSLFVSYNSVAETSCHLALGWPIPSRVLDLYTEFRCLTNQLPLTPADLQFNEQMYRAKGKSRGKPTGKCDPRSNSLLSALNFYDLPYLDMGEKTKMRDLVLTGGPWSGAEQEAILNYCNEDVVALERLLPAMAPQLSLVHSLYRGRYMTAVARMIDHGVPIDMEMRARLERNWDAIQLRLIEKIDRRYGVYDGLKFKTDRFERFLTELDWSWPRHPSGALSLDRDTFRDMAKVHPELMDLLAVLILVPSWAAHPSSARNPAAQVGCAHWV